MNAIELARTSLKRDEGISLKPYRCTADRLTIGYGRNIEDKGISFAEAEDMLDNDIAECVQDLGSFTWWNKLTDPQQAALINLRFNLGPTRFRNFKQMLRALDMGDYTEASHQVKNSLYATQVGERANRIAAGILR